MAADVTYSVEVQYFTKGNVKNPFGGNGGNAEGYRASREFARAYERAFEGIGNMADKMIGGMVTAFEGVAAVAGGGLVTAIGLAAKEGIAFADTLESAKIGLATILHMQKDVDMSKGMEMSGRIIEKARKDAQALPGEFKDLVNIMSAVAPAGTQNGLSIDKIEEMSAQAMAAAKAMNVSMPVAGRQLAMMLEGRMTRATAFGLRLGFTPQSLNKMSGDDRISAIQAALAKTTPAIEEYKHSFSGLTSAMTDNLRNVAAHFANPLFESIKTSVERGLSFFDKNEGIIMSFAHGFGEELRRAFEWATQEIIHWTPIVYQFAQNLRAEFDRIFGALGPSLKEGFAGLEKFLTNPESIKKLEHAIVMLTAISGGAKFAGSLGTTASILAPLMGVAPGALAAVAGPVAAAGAAIALAGIGMAEAVMDTKSIFHRTMMDSISHTGELLKSAGDDWKFIYDESIKPGLEGLGTALALCVEGLAGWAKTIGSYGKETIEYNKNQFNRLIWESAAKKEISEEDFPFARPAGMAPGGVWQRTGTAEDNQKFLRGEGNGAYTYLGGDTNDIPRNYMPPEIAKDISGALQGLEEQKKKDPPKTSVNIHNVEIKVNSNQDPNRVAKATAQELIDIMRHPKLSRFAPSGQTIR